jgi:hypothetical protein
MPEQTNYTRYPFTSSHAALFSLLAIPATTLSVMIFTQIPRPYYPTTRHLHPYVLQSQLEAFTRHHPAFVTIPWNFLSTSLIWFASSIEPNNLTSLLNALSETGAILTIRFTLLYIYLRCLLWSLRFHSAFTKDQIEFLKAHHEAGKDSFRT